MKSVEAFQDSICSFNLNLQFIDIIIHFPTITPYLIWGDLTIFSQSLQLVIGSLAIFSRALTLLMTPKNQEKLDKKGLHFVSIISDVGWWFERPGNQWPSLGKVVVECAPIRWGPFWWVGLGEKNSFTFPHHLVIYFPGALTLSMPHVMIL